MKTTNQLIGTIGSDPRTGTLPDGRPYIGFRLAVDHSYFNADTGAYTEGATSWYDVAAYGALAQSSACSLSKGDPVLVIGRLRVRDWTNGERSGTAVEIVADALGHNLRFGTGSFSRHAGRRRVQDGEEERPADGPGATGSGWGGLPPAGDPFATPSAGAAGGSGGAAEGSGGSGSPVAVERGGTDGPEAEQAGEAVGAGIGEGDAAGSGAADPPF